MKNVFFDKNVRELEFLGKNEMTQIIGGFAESTKCIENSKSCNANEQCCSKKCSFEKNDLVTGKRCKK